MQNSSEIRPDLQVWPVRLATKEKETPRRGAGGPRIRGVSPSYAHGVGSLAACVVCGLYGQIWFDKLLRSCSGPPREDQPFRRRALERVFRLGMHPQRNEWMLRPRRWGEEICRSTGAPQDSHAMHPRPMQGLVKAGGMASWFGGDAKGGGTWDEWPGIDEGGLDAPCEVEWPEPPQWDQCGPWDGPPGLGDFDFLDAE